MNDPIEKMRAQVREYDNQCCQQEQKPWKDPRGNAGNAALCEASSPKECREIPHRLDILRDRQDRLVNALQKLTVSLEPVLRPGKPDGPETKGMPQPPDETQLGGALANCITTTDRSIAMVDSIAACLQL